MLFRILEFMGLVWWAKTDRSWGLKQQRANLKQLNQELSTGRAELEDMLNGLNAIEAEFVKSKLYAGDVQTLERRIVDMHSAVDQLAAKYPDNIVVQRGAEKAHRFYERKIRKQG